MVFFVHKIVQLSNTSSGGFCFPTRGAAPAGISTLPWLHSSRAVLHIAVLPAPAVGLGGLTVTVGPA